MIETQDEMVTTNRGVELLQGLCEYSELMSSWIDKDDVCLVEEGEPVTEVKRLKLSKNLIILKKP